MPSSVSMSHAYPLAICASEAFTAEHAARTRYEAEALSDGVAIVALETEWLTPAPTEAQNMLTMADQANGKGFVQRYEDADGNPVLAVTYWKLKRDAEPAAAAPAPPPIKAPPPAPTPKTDHTDDLYFRQGRTKPRRSRSKPVDKRQMDLFSGPDQAGDERPDPNNPDIILTGEEGDGTSFRD